MNKLKAFYLKNKDSIIKPSVVLLVICIVITAVLALTNKLTAPEIAELEIENRNAAMERIIKADEYLEKEHEAENGTVTYYEAVTGSETVGYIFTLVSKGYGGDISVMTAINPDGTVSAVDILAADDETPGLGQNVTKESFYSQFDGLKNGISVVKNGADENSNEINAVTGATVSSKAVTKSVNEALSYFEEITAKKEAGTDEK